jgi:hygromycin-B 7''-O-kinase
MALAVTLPPVADEAAYREIYARDDVWLPAMRALAARHELSGEPRRLTLGTNVVFAVGDVVIKLFPPPWRQDARREVAARDAAADLPVPALLARGDIDGWPYLLQRRLPGAPAADIWDDLPPGGKARLLRDIGALVRRLHDVVGGATLDLDWDAFLAERIALVDEHHGAAEPWRRWIRERVDSFDLPPRQTVLLHGDLTADHFLFERDGHGRWQVTGLIDFGDARLGHPFYEFAALFAFYTIGQPALTAALLHGYGLDADERDRQALTTICLLHEFGTLDSFLERHAVESPGTFHAALWGNA